MTFNLANLWPILVTVGSNVIYQVCAKSMPEGINTFAALAVTYLTAAAASVALFYVSAGDTTMGAEHAQLNWVPFVLGISVVGLEFGSVFMYKVGWAINTGYVVQSMLLAVMLLLVGYILYKEPITLTKVCGIIVCGAGLYLINK